MQGNLTLEAFHALPDDPAVEREPIRGRVTTRERRRPRTASATSARVSHALGEWSDRTGGGTGYSLHTIRSARSPSFSKLSRTIG